MHGTHFKMHYDVIFLASFTPLCHGTTAAMQWNFPEVARLRHNNVTCFDIDHYGLSMVSIFHLGREQMSDPLMEFNDFKSYYGYILPTALFS